MHQLSSTPPKLVERKETIFNNAEDIYLFHKVYVELTVSCTLLLIFLLKDVLLKRAK